MISSCLIVFQNIVPISLYITIEIVKTVSVISESRSFPDSSLLHLPGCRNVLRRL